MADYLHGVETQPRGNAPKNVSEVKTSVIGIVGKAAAPTAKTTDPAEVNTPVTIASEDDIAKKLGDASEEGTLPYYISKMYENFGKTKPMIIAVSVGSSAGSETEEPEDTNVYLVDHEENIIVDGDGNPIVVESSASASSATEETEADAADAISGEPTMSAVAVAGDVLEKTGVFALLKSQVITGYVPKIIIAPGYSQDLEVAQAMKNVCVQLRARGFVDIDSVEFDTVDKVWAARERTDVSAGMHHKNISLFWPRLKSGDKLYPMSLIAAAVRAKTDMDSSMGYHWSISSKEINGFSGLEIPVVYSLNTPGVESQRLNERGIVTVKNVGGLKFCGNCNSSFDEGSAIGAGNTDHEIFEVTKTVGDVIEESIEYYTEQRIDQPITTPWIDAIVRDVNNFLTTLKARGAIAGGECWYDPDENEPTDLMRGHILFSYDDAATPPADRVTYQRSYNVEYLANLRK